MNDRIQIWMSREHFLKLKELLETNGEGLFAEDGPLIELFVAVEEAFTNNANWTEVL